jgi:hypothetical protein
MVTQALETHGGSVTAADLFEEAFRALEKDLPATTRLSLPKDPLVCLTGLLADADGNVHPQTDGQVRTD